MAYKAGVLGTLGNMGMVFQLVACESEDSQLEYCTQVVFLPETYYKLGIFQRVACKQVASPLVAYK
jgi:hypothetical protein